MIWKLITHNACCGWEKTGSSNPLNKPKDNQDVDIGCKTTGKGAGCKKDERKQKTGLRPKLSLNLPIKGMTLVTATR